MFWGGNGDVYVTIYENESSEEARDNQIGRPVTVSVGMGCSGQRIPVNIANLFAKLATEFEKYKDCKFESDAEMLEFNKKFDEYKEML